MLFFVNSNSVEKFGPFDQKRNKNLDKKNSVEKIIKNYTSFFFGQLQNAFRKGPIEGNNNTKVRPKKWAQHRISRFYMKTIFFDKKKMKKKTFNRTTIKKMKKKLKCVEVCSWQSLNSTGNPE